VLLAWIRILGRWEYNCTYHESSPHVFENARGRGGGGESGRPHRSASDSPVGRLNFNFIRIRKSLLISLLPKDRPYAERFQMARDAGFDAIEMQTIAKNEERRDQRGRRESGAAHSLGDEHGALEIADLERRS
jgi:hypothetical protein